MLEKLPAGVGRAIRGLRAGADDLAVTDTLITGVNASIDVSSPAFDYNTPIPERYTADGAGMSPPLRWMGVPRNAESLVLLIEDADSPTVQPLVHAIVWDLPPQNGGLAEGALPNPEQEAQPSMYNLGRNSYFTRCYLPPDPPPGHGVHRYVFQFFALDTRLKFRSPPGRSALLHEISGRVIAKGLLIGIYERH